MAAGGHARELEVAQAVGAHREAAVEQHGDVDRGLLAGTAYAVAVVVQEQAAGDRAGRAARCAADHALRSPGAALVAQGQEHRSRSEEHTSELQSLMRISYAV